MSEWLPVNRATLNTGRTESFKGVAIKLFLSPYDIPEAISGGYDEKLRKFVIAFKYMNEEPTVIEKQDELISLCIGKNSQRIWAIHVDVDAAKASAVKLGIIKQVDRAIDQFGKSRLRFCPAERFDIPRKVIEEKQDVLLAGEGVKYFPNG